MADDLISVWWDIEDCQVPQGHMTTRPIYSIDHVKHAIADYPSPVSLTFYAIGDMSRMCRPTKAALQESGIILCDIPRTGEPVKTRAP